MRAEQRQACSWRLLPTHSLLLTGLVWRIWLAFLITPVMGQASATATSSGTFFGALTNKNVSLILIPPDNFQLLPGDWAQYNWTHPYVLDRDLVIRTSTPPELGQMDFQFLTRKVMLAPNVTLKLERLVLRNINKLGGFGLDFFMGDEGSVIDVSNSVRVKLVCAPSEQSLRAAQSFSAPEGFPMNVVAITDGVCVVQNNSNQPGTTSTKCYDDAINFSEFTLNVGTVDPDAGMSQPGYRLRMQNVTRVCDNYVSDECIQQQSEDRCTAQLLSQLLTTPAVEPGWQASTIAGVVVGATLGFLAVCCVMGWLLWKHRQWWTTGNDHDGAVEKDEGRQDGGTPDLLGGADEHKVQQQLLLSGRTPDASQAVRLGVLLGSGSFGRVFKGRWHGMDVAVKVMDGCTPTTLSRVLKEAEVMMGLKHPNIVKAYQCSVWSKKQQQQLLQAAEQRKAAQATPQHKTQSCRQGAQRRSSSGSTNLLSSNSASTAASSSSTAEGMLGSAARPGAVAQDSVVINIVPQFVPRVHQGAAAAAAVAGLGVGPEPGGRAATVSSSSAAGLEASCPASAGVVGAPRSSLEAASSPLRKLTRLWLRQQQELPDQVQGPSTGSRSREQWVRPAATPLSSAAYALSGSSSMGVTTPGTSSHTAAGVISSSQGPSAFTGVSVLPGPSSLTVSSSSTGAGTSGASGQVSSPVHTVSSGGGARNSSSSAGPVEPNSGQSSDEIQPAPRRHLFGWLGGHGRRSREVPDLVPGSNSSSSRVGSAAAHPLCTEEVGQEADDELQVWLVLELCTGGSLKDAVSCGKIKTDSCHEMAKLLCRLLDAANGMAYLHSQDVLHGDLKAANVLLQHCISGSYGQTAKVSDFGVSAKLLDGATHRSTTSLGTITHMAAEVLRHGRLSKPADVYAFGIMMWEVFTNQTAYAGCHSGAVVERVVLRGERPPVPAGMPVQYALLMQRCWAEEPAARPTFDQVVTCLELLLDNLTSSDSDGRISEGVEEDRTSSNTSEPCAADKQAAAAAAAEAAAVVAATQVVVEQPSDPTYTPLQHEAACTSTQQLSTSSSGQALLRYSTKESAAGIHHGPAAAERRTAGQGLGESVEEAVGSAVSGPHTPGFQARFHQLGGLYESRDSGCYLSHGTAAGSDAQMYRPGLSSTSLSGRVARWLEQGAQSLGPSSALNPRPAQQQQPGVGSGGWWPGRQGLQGAKLRAGTTGPSSVGSSSHQQPGTPRHSSRARDLC